MCVPRRADQPNALQLLTCGLPQHIPPAVYSISHLGLLVTIGTATAPPPADLPARVSLFLATFDARQIRYAGKNFSIILESLVRGNLFPVSGRPVVFATVTRRSGTPC